MHLPELAEAFPKLVLSLPAKYTSSEQNTCKVRQNTPLRALLVPTTRTFAAHYIDQMFFSLY